MLTLRLRYRTWFKGLPLRLTRLAVPGWAGEPQDGATAQPWHCHPFADAASYGLELVYPFEAECRVRTDVERSRRERLDEAVVAGDHLAIGSWRDANGRRFDNRHKVLRRLYEDGGARAVLCAVRGGRS